MRLPAVLLFLLLFQLASYSVGIEPEQLQPDAPTEIIYALPYEFSEYSYWEADSYATFQWVSAVYTGLLRRTVTGIGWVPDLAVEMPTVSSDGLNFTITLRSGVTFDTGDTLTADDVVFSYRVVLEPLIKTDPSRDRQVRNLLNEANISKISNDTVQFSFSNHSIHMYAALSMPIISQLHWGDRFANCQQFNTDCDWNSPTGSDVRGNIGPFLLDSIQQEEVVLVKNPTYWNASETMVDRIRYIQIEDKRSAIAELATGRIDIMDSQYVPGLTELAGIDNLNEFLVPDSSHQEISLNHMHPVYGTGASIPDGTSLTDDQQARLVRKAFSHIVNREFFATVALEGLAAPAVSSAPMTTLGYDHSIEPDAYNITLARELMEKAGFDYSTLEYDEVAEEYTSFFFNMTVLAPNTSFRTEWSFSWKDELPKIGIKGDYVQVGWDQIIPRTFGYPENTSIPVYSENGYDVLFVGYGWSYDWDPSGLYTRDGWCDVGNCDNFYNYENASLPPLLDQYSDPRHIDSRADTLSQIQVLLADDLPIIPILHPKSHLSTRIGVSGINPLLFTGSQQNWADVSNTRMILDTTTQTITVTGTETNTVVNTETETHVIYNSTGLTVISETSTTVITEYVEEPQAAISPVPPITLLGLLVLPLFRRRTKE